MTIHWWSLAYGALIGFCIGGGAMFLFIEIIDRKPPRPPVDGPKVF
jgi:hypothetical protein